VEQAFSYVSMDELQKACQLEHANNPRDPGAAVAAMKRYKYRVLAVDWGGGGDDGVSLTVVSVMGITNTGVVDVIWAKTSNDSARSLA